MWEGEVQLGRFPAFLEGYTFAKGESSAFEVNWRTRESKREREKERGQLGDLDGKLTFAAGLGVEGKGETKSGSKTSDKGWPKRQVGSVLH